MAGKLPWFMFLNVFLKNQRFAIGLLEQVRYFKKS